jgi:hypothetical protein
MEVTEGSLAETSAYSLVSMLDLTSIILLTLIIVVGVIALVAVQASKKLSVKLSKSLELIKSLHTIGETREQRLEELENSLVTQKAELVSLQQSLQANPDFFKASSNGSTFSTEMGDTNAEFAALVSKVDQIEANLEELTHQDPAAKIYTKAQTMVKNGAEIEEVMEACDLPRAEVEIMVGYQEKAKI